MLGAAGVATHSQKNLHKTTTFEAVLELPLNSGLDGRS
jgi:hypothetical protein